jgi:hypothetical protein
MIYNNFIYIHIPKTGGSSIRNSLNKNYQLEFNASKINFKKMGFSNLDKKFENYNFSIQDFKDHLPYQLIKKKGLNNNKFIFTFVRNPFSRLISLFFEITRDHKNHKRFNNGNKISFENFVKKITKKSYWFSIPMIDYLGKKNLNDINFIGKFENFENDIFALKKKFKIKIITKHHNHNNSIPSKLKFTNYTNFYSNNKIINLVYKYYKEDFNEFNYNFDDFLKFEKKKINSFFIFSRILKRKLINLI